MTGTIHHTLSPASRLAAMDPAFMVCLGEASGTPGLVAEFDRLQGANLSRRGCPLDLMIDDATGRMDADLAAFVEFVREAVYERLPSDALDGLRRSA